MSERSNTTQTPQSAAPLAYSVPDAAKAIGVSKNTVWNLVRDGELRRVKLGARTLVRADDLRALLDRKTLPSGAAR